MNIELHWLFPALYWITGVALGYAFYNILARARANDAQRSARVLLEDARRERDALIREAQIQSERKVLEDRQAFDVSVAARRKNLEQLEYALDQRRGELLQREASLRSSEVQLCQREAQVILAMERVAGISREEARQQIIRDSEVAASTELAALIRKAQDSARSSMEEDARQLLITTMERAAPETVSSVTTDTIRLADDDLKARVIGKEGRNIRAFEQATGADLVIDETPNTVVVSCFDPFRRAVARIALERLIADGRIHPAHIEETVQAVEKELLANARTEGEAAATSLALSGFAPEVLEWVGRLRYRNSYGQNVLAHSIEMGRLMGMIAAEVGLNEAIARRAGLLHDLGKAFDAESGSRHAQAGADFLRRHGESDIVCNAVAAHHREEQDQGPYAVLTRIGDAITAGRPGARRESTQHYLQRLANLEAIARGFTGVEKCYAIQAGREIRVLVNPAQVTDDQALLLARDISKAIAEQLEFPGMIRVTVIREMRAVEYAR